MMQQVTKSLKKGISRRTTILITLLCLLVVSSYANYRLGLDQAAIQTDLPVVRVQGAPPASSPTPQTTQDPSAPQNSSFSSYRNQRGEARAQEIQMLDQLIADTTTGGDSLEQARTQKLALVRSMEQETALEGLLKARGYADALVSARSGSVTVVVQQDTLTSAEATQIMELTTVETGEPARNIKIIPTK